MRIYGDESGDPGMGAACSAEFTVAFILFETTIEAEACSQAIQQVKALCGLEEFHWVETHSDERRAFLEAVSAYRFNYVIQTLVKANVKSRDFNRRAFFYERVAEKMAAGIEVYLRIAAECRDPEPLNGHVILDKNEDPRYRRAMENHLKAIKDSRRRALIKNVATHRSKSDNLIQPADMICGAARHDRWRQIVEDKALSKHLKWP